MTQGAEPDDHTLRCDGCGQEYVDGTYVASGLGISTNLLRTWLRRGRIALPEPRARLQGNIWRRADVDEAVAEAKRTGLRALEGPGRPRAPRREEGR